MAYEVIPLVEMGRNVRPGTPIPAADAKAAARLAVATVRRAHLDEIGYGYRSVSVVSTGGDANYPLMSCRKTSGRTDAASSRAHRLAFERRGGVSQYVRCEVISPSFKKALTKKAPKRRRKAR